MKGREILGTIDSTLDQLIRNAEAMSNAQTEELSSFEVEAFQKTQESLLAKLLHMDEQLQETSQRKKQEKKIPSYQIQEKLHYFQRLNARFSSGRTRPFIRKIRKKKSLAAKSA